MRQVGLDQLEDRQVEGERAIEQHEIDLASDMVQRVERVPLADFHQIGEAGGFQVRSRPRRLGGLDLAADQLAVDACQPPVADLNVLLRKKTFA